MWNIAADGNGNLKLPGTDSCGGSGCRPLATVNDNGSTHPTKSVLYIFPLCCAYRTQRTSDFRTRFWGDGF